MDIAYDAKRTYHNRRGLGNYSRDLIRLMVEYAPLNNYFLFNPTTNGAIELPFADKIIEINPSFPWKIVPSLWRSCGCRRELGKIKADIYHGLSGELPYGIDRLGCRKIVTIHDAIFMRYPQNYSAAYRELFYRKCCYACKTADTIVAISQQTKRDCITYFGADERKIEVIYQGCNNQFNKRVNQQHKKIIAEKYSLPDNYILYIGAIEPNKNIDNLIRGMRIAHIDIPLLVVSQESKYAPDLIRLAEQENVSLEIRYNVPFSYFPAIYQQATAFAFMSYFEGFGIPVLEAVSSHIPILASNSSCLEETGGRAAIYAAPDKPDEIATQLYQLINDETLREQLIKNSHNQAKLFSDSKIADNLIRLYQS